MSWRCARLGSFGRRLVSLMLEGSHHGKGEHDERDVTMPAVPGSGFVVVEIALRTSQTFTSRRRPPRLAGGIIGSNQCPFGIRQVTRISQTTPLSSAAMFRFPHLGAPPVDDLGAA